MLKNKLSNSSFYGSTAAEEEDPTFDTANNAAQPPTLGCYTRFDTNDVSVRTPQIQGRGLKAIVFTMFLLAVFVSIGLFLQIYHYGKSQDLSSSQKTIGEDPICSNLGDDVMRRGGNAVDAVIAAQICMSLVAPHLTGLGGGGLLLIQRRRSNSSVVVDFRETAPGSAVNTAKYMVDPGSISEGRNSVGVPGFIKGLEAAHGDFGSKSECCSWSSLIHLALNAVKRRFVMSESFKNATLNKISLEFNSEDMSNLRSFIRPDQKMVPGEVHESKLFDRLIQSYVLIASNGSNAFYEGPLGRNIVAETSGAISLEDLKSYKVMKEEPISTIIGNKYRIFASGPPSAGPKLIAAFSAIDTLKNERGVQILQWDYFKKLITAADRLQRSAYDLGDPSDPQVQKVVDTLMDKSLGELLISDMHDEDAKEYRNYPKRAATTGANVAAMDAKDLYVSSFTSLNAHFGSKFMTSDGIILNNALSNFNIPSREGGSLDSINLLAKGRRPATSAVVALVSDTEDVCGTRIAIGGADYFNVAQVLSNSLVYGLDLKSSLQTPRIFVTNETTGFELAYPGIDPKILKEYSRTNPYYLRHLPYNTINVINKTLDLVSPLRDPRSGVF